MNFNFQPVLENSLVLLRPLKKGDFEYLFEVASDPLIWEQHQNKNCYTREGFSKFFDEALASKSAFIVCDGRTKNVIGSSRFKMIDEAEGVVEIGWSFLARNYWGGTYNREMKKLMVNYALESFKRIVFYVNPKNFRSQHALGKLGAKRITDPTKLWVLPADKGITYTIDKVLK